MALTPEEVLNKTFEVTKFRDGYDMDQVDDLLDQIVVELRQRDEEIARLQDELDAANARVAELESGAAAAPAEPVNVAEQTIVVDAQPEPAAEPEVQNDSGFDATAVKSSAMLQLALELHDKYIRDGEEQRDRTVGEAQVKATQLVEDAQRTRADELRRLEDERKDFATRIAELREFESEYRNTLASYIQAQLRELEGSPEPKGAPKGLD